MTPLQTLLLLLVFHALLAITAEFGVPSPPPAPAPAEPKTCPAKCGEVEIPYPFGIGTGCSLSDDFALTCNETTSPPSLLTGEAKVASITLETAQMVVYTHLTYSCDLPINSTATRHTTSSMALNVAKPFLLSPSENVFTAVGCSLTARINGRSDIPYLTGCITTCARVNDTGDDGTPCSGHGCCQASLTPNLTQVSVEWEIRRGRSPVAENMCQYAFVATKGWYSFSKNDLIGNMTFLTRFGSGPVVPVVLDWAIRDGTCPSVPHGGNSENVSYGACVSTQSYCVNASNGTPGYFCDCSKGYTGNPYIKNGCTNINECELRRSANSTIYKNMYPCHEGTCHDTEGDYECKCNLGRKGDGKSAKGCELLVSSAGVAAIGTISATALLVVLLIFLYMEREKRKLRDRFNKNGGQLLKSLKIEIFTKEKLDHITNNYCYIIGQGAFGKVYRGTTGAGDSSRVAVKCSIPINEDWKKESFANEITIQSNISHRNLVQLLGCCVETEVPMLVYEYVSRGSLHDVLHGDDKVPLPLETRLDIAIYSAVALGYMHSEASQRTIILHGDVKSGNILLDEGFTPKVSDFGTSRLMSIDKDHTNWVVGDKSYIDPVYMKTGLLTEKSDVYSFGIVLLELVTRKKARYDGNHSLPMDYVKAFMGGAVREMFDPEVASGGEEDEGCLEEVGKIAVQCLEEDVDDRPAMSEVVERLKTCKCRWLEGDRKTNKIST
ncbi:wall-associated receptor kinase 2-like [Hordeum vulgare subsp. vulgare]|uniref:Protein kinase domain-containing protein n=1 Tax=Hordeum vulgare subsp. vulgare TaxID=112509 RepID=A0A8I6X0Y9_HORVV|nr:wall-associated receptor kinase 2-like [Hordeum vulgare subsp. vulgare]